MSLLTPLDKRGAVFWLGAGCFFVAAIGLADFATGNELGFSLFYLLPIAMVAWFSGRPVGVAISSIAAVTWLATDSLSGQTYSHAFIGFWNAAIRLGMFLVVALLLPALRELEHEKALARIDHLTGTANRRHFFEIAQAELDRSQRYRRPFTVVYIDLDGFKSVNDRFGHRAGDRLLRALAERAKRHLRRTDVVARLGGDEFACLLPEIGAEAARAMAPKLQAALLDEMQVNQWPVTFSIGVLTYESGAISVDELIRKADDLMYSVKRSGKNALAYTGHTG